MVRSIDTGCDRPRAASVTLGSFDAAPTVCPVVDHAVSVLAPVGATLPTAAQWRTDADPAARFSATLSQLDRSVIHIAILDRRRLSERYRSLAALTKLGGGRPANRLADPGLEALRIYAKDHPIRREKAQILATKRLRDAGYSPEQILSVDHISGKRRLVARAPRRVRRPSAIIVMLSLGCSLYAAAIQIGAWAPVVASAKGLALQVAPGLMSASSSRHGQTSSTPPEAS